MGRGGVKGCAGEVIGVRSGGWGDIAVTRANIEDRCSRAGLGICRRGLTSHGKLKRYVGQVDL